MKNELVSILDEPRKIGRRGILSRVLVQGGGLLSSIFLTRRTFAAEGSSAAATPNTFSHIHMCVSDIQRSMDFYCNALGFEKGNAGEATGPNQSQVLEIKEAVTLKTQMVRLGPLNLELLQFVSPGHKGDAKRRAMNQLGLAALSFRVTDLDRTLKAVRDAGGTVLDNTRIKLGTAERPVTVMFCTDPDGVRLEIVKI